jgi:hypothetical protein
MEDEYLFVLNTQDLADAGFDGSFNDLADDIEQAGGTVEGSYDEEGNPVMTIGGIEDAELQELLSDYGVEDPESFTEEPSDDMDFDAEVDDADIEDDDLDDADDVDDIPDDAEFEIEDVDDEDDEDDDIDDEDEDIDDEDDEEDVEDIMPVYDDEQVTNESIYESLCYTPNKGTANLSESVTSNILKEVSDKAILKRIQENIARKVRLNEALQHAAAYDQPLQLTPFSNVKINEEYIWNYSNKEIVNMLREAYDNYKKYKKLTIIVNESTDPLKATKLNKIIKKQAKLVKTLNEYRKYREALALNEDDEVPAAPAESTDDGMTATLTAIDIKVKDADAFIKVLTDAGIPEEALEKVNDTDASGSDEQPAEAPNAAAPAAPAPAAPAAPAMGGAPGENPFESVRTVKGNPLNEDENPFAEFDDDPDAGGFGDPDQPATDDANVDPMNTKDTADSAEGQTVRLTDTSYATKLQKVLEDKYNVSKEDFENMIGGSIEDADAATTADSNINPETGAPENSEKEGEEETINPLDVFGDQ